MLNDFLISLVGSFGFSIFLAKILTYFGTGKWFHEIKERLDKEERKALKNIIRAITIIIAVILIAIIGIDSFTGLTFYNNNDVSNWVTLTVEIGVGIVIAVIILIYSLSREKVTAMGVTQHIDQSFASLGGTTGGTAGSTTGGTVEESIPYKVDDKPEKAHKGKNGKTKGN